MPASADVLKRFAKLMEHHDDMELAVHFHVYRDGPVLLEWHDVSSSNQPVLLAATMPEADVRALTARFQAEVGRTLWDDRQLDAGDRNLARSVEKPPIENPLGDFVKRKAVVTRG